MHAVRLKADADVRPQGEEAAAGATAPKKDDDWWQRAKIDIRDGLLATELTPPQFVQERFGLVIPTVVEGFARAQARGVGEVPQPRQRRRTTESTGHAPVRIDSPKQGSYLKNNVRDHGQGGRPRHFIALPRRVGAGAPPLEWDVLARSDDRRSRGELAEWDVSDLPDGIVHDPARSDRLTSGVSSPTFVLVNVGKMSGATRRPCRRGRRTSTSAVTTRFG